MKRLTPTRIALVIGALGVLLVVVCWLCLQIGIVPVRLADAFDPSSPNYEAARSIIRDWRLPRILIAALVGGALSASGVVFQALLRNPLADPYILGVSGGSAVGAVICIALGFQAQFLGFDSTFVFAFAGAAGALALVYSLARVRAQVQTHTLLLAGVIVNSFCGAVIVFLLTTVKPREVGHILNWIIGSINVWKFDDYGSLAAVGGMLAAGFAVVAVHGRALNLFALGELSAEQLGVNTRRSRLVLLIAASVMTAAAVGLSGPIGFVGLVIPHALRMVLGPDHRLLLPASLLFGAAFLVGCDTFGRVAFSLFSDAYESREVPVGVITAMVGGPFFLFLLKRRSKRASFAQEEG